MTVKRKQEKIKSGKSKNVEEENLNNKIFVIILGLIILVVALFGKVVNDNVFESYNGVKDNFILSTKNLSYVYETYSVTTVDGIVKVKNGLKKPEDFIFELSSRLEISNKKMKEYFEQTDCHKQKILDELSEKIEKSNSYWFKIMENCKTPESARQFCEETLESGELYEITDPILKDLSTVSNCHFERVENLINKSKNFLENFKKVCITSCVVGIILVGIVILDFIKDEIQKRRIDNISRKGMGRAKRIVRRKESV
jgi:hypothetical protein